MDKIKVEISFKDYFKLLLGLTYSKPVMIVILAVDVIVIAWIILFNMHVQGMPEITFFQYSTAVLISVVQPAAICISIRKNYLSSSYLKERLEIDFTPDLLKLNGESFYTELVWAKLYKIRELKNWFLIYENNFSAVIIPKKALTRKQEKELVEFLKSIPGLNLRLINRPSGKS